MARRSPLGAEGFDLDLECLRPARVAEGNLVPCLCKEPCGRAADVAGSDDSDANAGSPVLARKGGEAHTHNLINTPLAGALHVGVFIRKSNIL